MKLNGSLMLDGKILRESVKEANDENLNFREKLEKCFLELCRELEIPVPLWMKKNTTELGAFGTTFFPREQFIEKVWFDRFVIKIRM